MDYNELLITAAKKYQELTTYDYTIITGQKRKLDKKRILITADAFKHLSGFHKAKNHTEIYTSPSGALLRRILSGKFDINKISSDECFSVIIKRLEHLIYLEKYLDEFMCFYHWSQKDAANAGIYSTIDAEYMIPCNCSSKVFLFLTVCGECVKLLDVIPEDDSEVNLNSQADLAAKTFIVGNLDYTRGQRRPPVLLYKDKYNRIKNERIVLLNKLSSDNRSVE